MTETFAAVRDALERAAAPVYLVKMDQAPRLPRPAYLPKEPAQTRAQYTAALAKLGRLGIVRAN